VSRREEQRGDEHAEVGPDKDSDQKHDPGIEVIEHSGPLPN